MTRKQKLQTIGLDLKRISEYIAQGRKKERIDYWVDEIKSLMDVEIPENLKHTFEILPWKDLFGKKYSLSLADQLCTFGSIISLRARDL
ncbi:MAG: hypothetical protein Q7S14_00155 [bacterium]|nr:hypothetical protein [bacterium]